MRQGILAAFAEVNKVLSFNGRELALISYNDQVRKSISEEFSVE